jgi:hypothetical protein
VTVKKYVVIYVDGNREEIQAAIVDQDAEVDGYLYFLNDMGDLTGLFYKPIVASWKELTTLPER